MYVYVPEDVCMYVCMYSCLRIFLKYFGQFLERLQAGHAAGRVRRIAQNNTRCVNTALQRALQCTSAELIVLFR